MLGFVALVVPSVIRRRPIAPVQPVLDVPQLGPLDGLRASRGETCGHSLSPSFSITRRDAPFTVIVCATTRARPRPSNPYASSARAPSVARPRPQYARRRRYPSSARPAHRPVARPRPATARTIRRTRRYPGPAPPTARGRRRSVEPGQSPLGRDPVGRPPAVDETHHLRVVVQRHRSSRSSGAIPAAPAEKCAAVPAVHRLTRLHQRGRLRRRRPWPARARPGSAPAAALSARAGGPTA